LREAQFVLPSRADLHCVAGLEVTGQQALGERIEELVLDRALYRAGTELRDGAASSNRPQPEVAANRWDELALLHE
jgi:hypothetical protein